MCKLFKKKKLPLSESLLKIKKNLKKRQKRPAFLPPLTLEERSLIQQIQYGNIRTHLLGIPSTCQLCSLSSLLQV
ncbi:hypothetical protein DZB84_01040 [Bacillus sp. HNG]|nr:hypothetical protein DZB84_01040 [Bacillus sp. HNG]